MDTATIYEIIGYVASILVAVSLMMRSILRLRIINLLGALFFTVYGLLIRAYPVAAVNFFIVLIDLYYLYDMLKAKEYFDLLEVQPSSDYLHYFLDFYGDEIRKFMPEFDRVSALEEGQLIFFVLRDMVPAGLFIGDVRQEGVLCVALDFVIPGYRDFKIGRYVYKKQDDFFLKRGIETIYSRPGSETHASYLQRMGFERVQGEEGVLYAFHLEE